MRQARSRKRIRTRGSQGPDDSQGRGQAYEARRRRFQG